MINGLFMLEFSLTYDTNLFIFYGIIYSVFRCSNKMSSCLEYFKTRTHFVVASKDGVNNTIGNEEICVICQAEFKNDIGTLECRHEYHTGYIKQWLLSKNDYLICRAFSLKCIVFMDRFICYINLKFCPIFF